MPYCSKLRTTSTEQADDASMCHDRCAISNFLTAGHQRLGSIPEAEALSPYDAKAAAALINILGEYPVQALFSKTWQLRRSALLYIEEVLQGAGGGVKDPHGDFLKTLSLFLPRTLQDSVASVFHASLQVR